MPNFAREAVDFGFRTAYKTAHRMLRAYWGIRKPHTHGSLIAVWHDGRLLLVKNSYRREYTLPGGYVRANESPEEAAARELREEVGADVSPSDLELVYSDTKPYENRRDHVTICEVTLDTPIEFEVDNREVIWAGFRRPDEVLALPIVPHLREYLAAHPVVTAHDETEGA
ncbi:MAG: NUDIX hydrolase [Nannocystaceae bacterium]|nr:NUDIX hydrolase [bacterium]